MFSRYEELLKRAKEEYPRFNIRPRRTSWLQWIFTPLSWITRQDYSGFSTTIGSTLYAADGWDRRLDDNKYKTLRHELVHVDQYHRFPFGPKLWVLNHIIFAFCYLFVLPVRWTMRAKFEREGYFQTLLVEWELGGEIPPLRTLENARWIAQTFGGSAYAFMGGRQAAYDWAIQVQRRINLGDFPSDPRRIEAPPTPAEVVPLKQT